MAQRNHKRINQKRPPKRSKQHSFSAEKIADELIKLLRARTDGKGEELFAISAFVDAPGVAIALGFTEGTTALDVPTSAMVVIEQV